LITILNNKTMDFLLNSRNNQSLFENKDILSAFKENPEKVDSIEEGMSPEEIAEIVSDHFISEVKKQFEETKKALEEA